MRIQIAVGFVVMGCLVQNVASAQSHKHQVPEWMEMVEEIRIPRDGFGPSIRSVDISPAGSVIFVADGSAWYYSNRTKQLLRLDPERCRPGEGGRVHVTAFTPDGEILVGIPHQFYWFNLDGRCVHHRDGKDQLSLSSIALPGRRFVHLYRRLGGNELLNVNADGLVLAQGDADHLPMPNRSYRPERKITDGKGLFLLADFAAPVVAAYDADLNRLWLKEFAVDGLPWASQDVSLEAASTPNDAFIREMVTHADVSNVYAIDRNRFGIVARHQQAEFAVLQLFDREGTSLRQVRLPRNFSIQKMENGRAYLWNDDNDDFFTIYVYKVNL